MEDERATVNAYLLAGARKPQVDGALLASTSKWLNDAVVRDVVATWMLRKNGPDFPVESDHALGLVSAMDRIVPPQEVDALIAEERARNPRFNAFFEEGYLTPLRNEDYEKYAPGTVGGIIWRAIKDLGFDLTLGVDTAGRVRPQSDFAYWRLRSRQQHDFEHIITGGQYNSVGELLFFFARSANHATHLSPPLASALTSYILLSGLRLISRSVLHYPAAFLKVLECVEQGIKIGRTSAPIWEYRYEEVLDLSPADARIKLGVNNAYDIDSEMESAIFRGEHQAQAL